jgi:hypothetical protein
MICEYRFLDGSGQTVFDSSGVGRNLFLGENTGADSGDPTWISGGGIQFGGSPQTLNFGAGFPLFSNTDSLTIITVAGLNFDGSGRVLYSQGSPYGFQQFAQFYQATEDKLAATISSTSGPIEVPGFTAGVSCFAWTYNRPTQETILYQNGVQKGGGTHTGVATAYQTGEIRIGGIPSFGLYMTTAMHYFAAYTRALSPTEIATMQNFVRRLIARRGIILG